VSGDSGAVTSHRGHGRVLPFKEATGNAATGQAAARHLDGLNLEQVRWLIRAHRMRTRLLGDKLFGDPCWDLILELLLARVEQRAMQTCSLGICAEVPAATAHRWLERLVANGLVNREADARDGRRVYVRLSDPALVKIEAYLATLFPAPQFFDATTA
jgi:DNA-binding transcriptional ArsR family regulator